ncbi:MAG: ATP-binding protein [Nitrospirae bacterium YQR-1]
MTIKSKLWIIVLLPFISVVTVGTLVILDSYYDEIAVNQKYAVIDLLKKTFETSIIANEMLLRCDKNKLQRLESLNSMITQIISRLHFKEYQQQELLREIAVQHKELINLYLIYYNLFLSQNMTDMFSPEYINKKNIIANHLLLKAHTIVTKAIFLREIVESKQIELQRRFHVFIVSVTGAFVIIILFVSVKLGKNILRGLKRLQEGIEIISSGNLQYIIPHKSTDEIGVVADYFNTMTVKLREIYLSLEKEILRRKLMEENLNTEISTRIKIEIKLKEVSNQLQSIMDSSTAVIFLKDIQGRYILINSRYETLFHINRHDVISKTDHDIFPKEAADSFRANDIDVIEKNMSLQYEEIVPHDDGMHTYISIKFPLYDVKGQIYAVCGIATDITQRKRMEEELKNLNINLETMVEAETKKRHKHEQMLIQQSKMASMGEMIGLIAHQWKQPINAVGLVIQDLKDSYTHGEINGKFIDDVVGSTMQQIDFMAKTIDDFKNFFIPSKKKVLFDVKTTIDELLSMFKHVFSKSNIDISVKADHNVLMLTEGYPNEFKQVVLNMLNNSKDAIVSKKIKDSDLKGSILINIDNSEDKSRVIVSIRDNGGGIPDDVVGRIFEPYFTTKEQEGTGIGLYMSKTIIETNMGGSLMVYNVDGGAEFMISLDVHKSESV